MKKAEMNFKTNESLDGVRRVINESSAALNDPSRIIANSAIPEALGGALGATTGGAIGFAGLFYGGSVAGLSAAGITSGLAAAGSLVGGGMAAGVAVLAAPAVVLGGTGVAIVSFVKYKKLKNEKRILCNAAIVKQNAIATELMNKVNKSKERIDYLTGLNTLLQAAIRDLKHDL